MNNEKRFFIEIGSADMDTCIPLAENGWNGIIVEPINAYLKNLKRVDGVIYVNLGISGDGSDYDITYIDMNYYTRKGFYLNTNQNHMLIYMLGSEIINYQLMKKNILLPLLFGQEDWVRWFRPKKLIMQLNNFLV